MICFQLLGGCSFQHITKRMPLSQPLVGYHLDSCWQNVCLHSFTFSCCFLRLDVLGSSHPHHPSRWELENLQGFVFCCYWLCNVGTATNCPGCRLRCRDTESKARLRCPVGQGDPVMLHGSYGRRMRKRIMMIMKIWGGSKCEILNWVEDGGGLVFVWLF